MNNKFQLKSPYKPAGDQPQAIKELLQGLKKKDKYQTLLGVTGSGKTYTMANVIEKAGRPTLVIAHNKTLAAQLCNEFREFFPDNAVEYFVSYYDYYQPEAYLPTTDTYIEKEATINDEIDRLRHAATQALLTRRDVIIVASVSCIYGLGSPESYSKSALQIKVGDKISRDDLVTQLIDMYFERNETSPERGTFRARGNFLEIMPANEEVIYRLELDGDKIKNIVQINALKRNLQKELQDIWVFPAKHFVIMGPERERAVKAIRQELKKQLKKFNAEGKLLEAERLERRTNYDIEMIENIGYCNGIENYSRPLSGRSPGEAPETLFSYFPDDFLLVIDESHVTVPQIRGMYEGDAARKRTLIEHGFRLPSAADNRPLKFGEFEKRINQAIFTSATPGFFEKKHSKQIVEQIIRPTGLIDPKLIIKPITETKKNKGQIDDLLLEIKKRVPKKERVIATTLTKKMAEDLSDYLEELQIKAKYLHSEVDTLDRIQILSDFRRGKFDVLVGVNLLREGLDLPEVTLVAILDADKEGFLRNETSLIQTIGRAARNVKGQVILYADNITGSIKAAVRETERRRKKQLAYNKKHNITPQTIQKKIQDITAGLDYDQKAEAARRTKEILSLETLGNITDLDKILKAKEKEMKEAAKNLEFELAAILRDEIKELKKKGKKK